MTSLRVPIVGAAALLLAALGASAQPKLDGFRPDRLILKPKAGHHAPTLNQLNNIRGRRLVQRFRHFNDLQVVELAPGSDVKKVINDYKASGLVDFAEPDYYLYPAATPNDPRYLNGSLWQFHNFGQSGGLPDADIDAPEAWDTLHSASNIIIAIVDTGVRATHEDLAANMWVNPDEIPDNNMDDDNNGIVDDIHGINVTAGTGDPRDVDGHGTQVASAAGAVGNNGLGITGVAWNVQIMACRFYDDDGSGSVSDAVTCFDYARSKGAHIVNASFVSTIFSSGLSSAINRLRNDGIILVAASGNDGINNDATPYYPASYTQDNIVAVGSTTRTELFAGYSNYGATSVDLAAPGSSLHLAFSSSDTAYVINNGTSFSSPMVAGALALIMARFPNDDYLEIINRLYEAVDIVPSLTNRVATGGRLNLANALGPSLAADFTATPESGAPPLDVQFIDASFGSISQWNWDFGDGTTSSDQNPTHRYDAEGIFNVTLTVTGTAGGTHTFTRELPVVANYSITAGTFSWINPSGMPTLSLANEGVSSAQSLPFPFVFYGRTYEELYVGANGLIGFIDDQLSASANQSLPAPNAPNAIICPLWDDLSPASGGTIFIGTVGSAPTRRTVITYAGVRHASFFPSFFPDFQVVLHEGSHEIEFQYDDIVRNRNAGSRGGSATVGVEDHNGLIAAQHSFNSPVLSNDQNIRFIPGWTGGLLTTPSRNMTSSGSLGGVFTPPSNDYTILNASDASIDWSAQHNESWITVTPSGGTLAPGASAVLTININSNAAALPPGTHLDRVSIINDSTGVGRALRTVTLEIDGTFGTLAVLPTTPFISSGLEMGPFTPPDTTYTLTNIGDTSFDWSAGITSSWASISQSSGNLPPGGTTDITVSLNPNAASFPPGFHVDHLSLDNLNYGLGSTNRFMALAVTQRTPGFLLVTPLTPLESRSLNDSPFDPESHTYTLTNTGQSTLQWIAQPDVDWITLNLSMLDDLLREGEETMVIATINENADALEAGTHEATISFLNLTTGIGTTDRTLRVIIDPPSHLEALPATTPGQFEFVLIGIPEHPYIIEATSDPPNWVSVSTNTTAADGRVIITQPITGEFRMFRAR